MAEPNGSGLPAVVTEGDLPVGDTAIHRHAQGKEAWELLKLLRLGKKTPAEMHEALAIEFEDLEISRAQLDRFLDRYVDPFIVVPDNWFKKGLVQANANLNHIARMAEIAKEMDDTWVGAKSKVGKFDDEGNPLGPTHSEHIRDGLRVQRAYEKQGEVASLIGMAPKAKDKAFVVATQVNVGVNLKEAAGGITIDAKSKDKTGQPA